MPIILIIIGIILIVYNYISLKKESLPFEIRDSEETQKKDNSFEHVLQMNKEDLNEYKIELGIFRKNIAESLTELQEEILEIKKYLNIINNDDSLYDDKIIEENISISNNDKNNQDDAIQDDIISEINFNNKYDNKKISDSKKTESIKELLNQGLSEEEICLRLSISKGEVLLVKDLFKK